MGRRLVSVGLGLFLFSALVFVPASAGAHDHEHAYSHGSAGHISGGHLPFVPGLVADPLADPDPTGQMGSGGRAVAFRPSGKSVPGSAQSRAPDALMFQTGVNAVEPTLGVDDQGRIFFIGVEGDEFPLFATETVVSADEGATWEVITPNVAGQSRHPITEDPYLYVDEDTQRVFTNDFLLPCSELSFSDDGGETWTSTVTACDLADHQTIFAGPPVTSQTTGYPNVVYYCAIDAGLAAASLATSCIKSVDGGLTFARTGRPAFDNPGNGPGEAGIENVCIGATGHGVADANGTIYLPRGWCGQPWLAISHDEGLSWTRVQVSDLGMGNGGGRLDHDAAVAVDTKGNIYYSWTAADFKPYLAVSRDQGETWSEPIMIAPPGVLIATLIAIDVTIPGRLAFSFLGSENKAQFGPNEYNGYMMMTTNGLSKDPLFYAATVNAKDDPIESLCSTGSCRVNREFIDVAIGPEGTLWASFVDGCFDGSCDHSGPMLGIGRGIVGRLVGGPRLR